MGRSPNHLTLAQFDLLEWVSNGCPGGVYEGSSHRVSARGLHNRGFITVVGKDKSWTSQITPEGVPCLKEQGKRVAVEREPERRIEQAKAECEREQQELRTSAIEMLEATVAAGGRLDLGRGRSFHSRSSAVRRLGETIWWSVWSLGLVCPRWASRASASDTGSGCTSARVRSRYAFAWGFCGTEIGPESTTAGG